MINKNNNKQSLRKHFRNLRRDLSSREKQQAANNIAQHLINHPAYQKAHHIGVYSALSEEASLSVFCEQARHDNKTLYLPIIDEHSANNQMHFQAWSQGAQLHANSLGIFEPDAASSQDNLEPLHPNLDLLLLPLVAYDKKAQRLGMGGGFYDRYINAHLNNNCLLIGIAFACQQANELPHEVWDKNLHAVVNEKEFLSFT